MGTKKEKVPAVNFVGTVIANVDNDGLSDADFRQFVRNTLPIIEKPGMGGFVNEEIRERVKKYYK